MDRRMDPGLDALEWPRFLSLAEKEALTERAKAIVRSWGEQAHWASSIEAARQRQAETQEMIPLLDREALWGPLQGLTDPDLVLERLERGAVLEVNEFVILRKWMYALDSWIQVPREEIRGEVFKKAISTLADPYEPMRILDRILTPEPDNQLSEKASPKLASIHSEIRSLKKEIGILLDQLIKTFSHRGVLQENFTDIRDGRYVVPIKISSQNEVEGIIYEASVSRQTVFVEPKEVAALNNRLRQRQNDLLQEVYLILAETSKLLKPFSGEIAQSVEILSRWDSVQARARLARHYGGKPIQVQEDRFFSLFQTAHPLLWWSLDADKIIHNEIEFGEPIRTLLLTGPNTGGKTVLLKVLGLAGICARTGFPFPGTGQLEVPFFDSFFADLGDPQSIEQHLSSFSGHIYRFKEILEKVSGKSLVLIDEFNSATDPEEGAALSRAFLEIIMSKGAMVVATTHDPQLKAIATSDQRILNASMAFNEETSEPTYKIVLGIPGRSRALETAERLGIPKNILELAKKYLSAEHVEFESLLSRLESDANEAARARKQAVALREEAERLKKEWTERTESAVTEMLDRTKQKLRRIVEQAQDEIRASVKKLEEAKSRKELDKTRTQVTDALSVATGQIESSLTEEAPEIAKALIAEKSRESTEEASRKITAGSQVRIPKWKNIGTVLEIAGSKVKVAMGTLQMTLPIADVELLASSKATPSAPPRMKGIATEEVAVPPSQIDLRGIRLEDAVMMLEKYLDQAFRCGSLAEVTIIHGLGTGALRDGTRNLLKQLPYIRSYHDGGSGRGGMGATVVEFERD